LFWDLAELGHRLAGEYFNLEPNLKFPLIRPNLAHFRPGITIDHRPKIKALAQRGKRFVRKQIAPADSPPERLSNSIVDLAV